MYMSPLKARTLVSHTATVLLFVALPSAFAQRDDIEDPNAYPGSWFRASLDTDGNFISGDGHGYNGGTWYYYPQTGWYRQWYYNHPYSTERRGYLRYEVYIRAVDPTKQTYVEINFNWTTPEWSQLGLKRPPLPIDTPTAGQESRYMMSKRLYVVDHWYIGTIEPIYSHIIEEYNPEWVSIDIRGQNAHLFRGAMHECQAKEGACCNPLTGQCTLTLEEDCPTSWLWLGSGTTCDACVLGIGGMDFGDAPDSYHTLMANDGARHTKVTGVFLGSAADIEPDGRPNISATGDDMQGTDDDDGVRLTSPLTPGETATLEVTASTAGYLNAWLDFAQDGDFDDAEDQIFSDELLAVGVNALSFRVLSTAAVGGTFARFRFDTRGLLSWRGLASDGEVEDYRFTIVKQFQPQSNSGRGGLLWSQAPQQFDGATPFIFHGWDERSDLSLHLIAVDDWQCENERPVTGFQWWGSFDGWTQPQLPSELPLAFHITLWTDGFDHPGTLVWEDFCTNWTWNVAGYNSDPSGLSTDTCFQFTCLLSQNEWFYPSVSRDQNDLAIPAVYWLSISVLYDPGISTIQYPWGWTTRPYYFNNVAQRVSSVSPGTDATSAWPPSSGSRWLSGAEIEGPEGTTWDFAFQLLTNEGASADESALAPVYRFWSDTFSSHFYTINENEKNTLIQDHADTWTFEGIAFYAYPPDRAPVGGKPVYRFWSGSLGRHFYTISETERQKMIGDSVDTWTSEGIAWYAYD